MAAEPFLDSKMSRSGRFNNVSVNNNKTSRATNELKNDKKITKIYWARARARASSLLTRGHGPCKSSSESICSFPIHPEGMQESVDICPQKMMKQYLLTSGYDIHQSSLDKTYIHIYLKYLYYL